MFYIYRKILVYNLIQLCCPICINTSLLGHILPADPAVSLCQARFLAAAELRSNEAAAPGCGTQTASVSLGCGSPGCLGKAPMPPCPCCPSRAVPGVGLRLAQCPSGSRSDRRAKEGEPAGRAAGPLEVTALPGSLRCLAAPSSAGQGQPYLCRQCLKCLGWHIPPSRPCCRWMEPSTACPSALPAVGGLMVPLPSPAWEIVVVFSESRCDIFAG